MRIRTRLLLAFLLLGATAVLAASVIGYRNARQSLVEAVERQLTGVRRARGEEIEDFFRTVVRHLRTLSESVVFVEGMHEFRAAFRELDGPEPPPAARAAVAAYYREVYLPALARLVPPRGRFEDYLPVGRGPYVVQDAYLVRNPAPAGKKDQLERSADGNRYDAVHARFHHTFRRLVDRFGYADLMLIDDQTGRIVYTVRKNPDFGTSLLEGPYRDTALARAFRTCRDAVDADHVCVSDFEEYEPALGAPEVFVCSAIFERGRRIGVLMLRLGLEEFDRVVSGDRGWTEDGLGTTGDVRIVGPDFLLRTNARGLIEDRTRYLARLRARGVPEATLARIEAYGSTALLLEVRLPSVEAALRGEEGVVREVGLTGLPTLDAYGPLELPGLHWAITARIDEAEALAPLATMRRRLLLFTALVLAATLAAAWLLARQIVRPVQALADAAHRLAEGDLAARAAVHGRDELAELAGTFNRMAGAIETQTREIEQKNRENEALLLSILPPPIATRLKGGANPIADNFAQVSVLFADIVGFTVMSDGRPPHEVVAFLNDLFQRFDLLAARRGVEKIKTIGDAYMAVAGLPTPCEDHARRMIEMALDMLDEARRCSAETGLTIELRIGVNSGPVVAGVIGASKFIYDLWGDTVNIASRMESHGVTGAIHVTRATWEILQDDYPFEARGLVEIKGKGPMETWLLRARSPAVAP